MQQSFLARKLAQYRLVFILAVGCLCAVLMLNGHLVPAGDNATYIVLGQSLATLRGYRMISDPRQPAMALYPPGYPLLLAGVQLLTGTANRLLAAILPMKLMTIVLYLAAIALAYSIFRHRDPYLATWLSLLMAVNPELLYFANEVSTEVPYLCLSLACIWLFARYWRDQGSGGLLVVAGLLGLTFYVRAIALVMLVAFGGFLFVHRRARDALLLLLMVGALVAPWFIYTRSLPYTGTSVGLGRGYFALYFSADPYGATRASLSDLITRLRQNTRIYSLEIWPDVLLPHASSAARLVGRASDIVLAAFSTLILIGFVLEVRRGHASELYVALFFASCVGYLWAQGRLIVPLIPFATYYLLAATDRVLKWMLRGRRVIRQGAVALVCALLAFSALVGDVRAIQRNVRYGLAQPVEAYYARDAEWSNYLQAMRWIAADAVEPAIVMCRKADLLYILTGHKALEYPYSADASELRRAVYDNQTSYLIEDAFTWTRTTNQYLRPALRGWQAEEPASLSLVFETDVPRTRVWRVREYR
jgi:hypothetical protein